MQQYVLIPLALGPPGPIEIVLLLGCVAFSIGAGIVIYFVSRHGRDDGES